MLRVGDSLYWPKAHHHNDPSTYNYTYDEVDDDNSCREASEKFEGTLNLYWIKGNYIIKKNKNNKKVIEAAVVVVEVVVKKNKKKNKKKRRNKRKRKKI